MIGWQEIIVRLLFAFILGSATAIDRKWYRTKQFIQSVTLMSMGAAMFALLISSTSEPQFSADLIIGISIVCLGVSWRQQNGRKDVDIDTVMKLWFAGAVGSIVGYGLFVPAYLGTLIVILTNLLLATPEKTLASEIESELNRDLELGSKLERIGKVAAWEHYYRCNIRCLAEDEAELLALLIKLSNEQNLMPTKISSKNLIGKSFAPEIEIQIDFICDRVCSKLPIQQVMMSLKAKLPIISATWIDLSSEQVLIDHKAGTILG